MSAWEQRSCEDRKAFEQRTPQQFDDSDMDDYRYLDSDPVIIMSVWSEDPCGAKLVTTNVFAPFWKMYTGTVTPDRVSLIIPKRMSNKTDSHPIQTSLLIEYYFAHDG